MPDSLVIWWNTTVQWHLNYWSVVISDWLSR